MSRRYCQGMCRILLTLLLGWITFNGIAQDEIMLKGDTIAVNYEVKIKKIKTDTLYYRAFGRDKYFLSKNVIAYRYKDSTWAFLRKDDKTKYLVRQGVLKIKHLQPDIILKRYEMKESHVSRVKKLPDHLVRLPYKERTKVLKKGRSVILSLYTDTTKSSIGMPLKKICNDSLYFIAELYNQKKLYGIPAKDIQYIVFDIEETMAIKALAVYSAGFIGGLIAQGVTDPSKKPLHQLTEADWKMTPITNR